jgi:hypothetical protein
VTCFVAYYYIFDRINIIKFETLFFLVFLSFIILLISVTFLSEDYIKINFKEVRQGGQTSFFSRAKSIFPLDSGAKKLFWALFLKTNSKFCYF